MGEVSLEAVDDELRWYLTRSRSTYAKFTEMHKPISDLIVDGMKPPDEIINDIIYFIEKKQEKQRGNNE